MSAFRFRETGGRDRQIVSDARVRLLCFITLSLISIICLSRWGISHQNPLAFGLSYVTDPLQSFFSGASNEIADRYRSWHTLIKNAERIQRLEQENRRLKKELVLFELLGSENERLRRLHELAQSLSQLTVPADVIGHGGGEFRTLVLNRGSQSGVKVNQPVLSYGGLVGRVMSVRPHSCLVLLITDPNSAVGSFAASTPDEATAEAVAGVVSGHRTIHLIFEPEGGRDVDRDTPVFTSAYSTIYPAGLLIGWIRGPLERGYSLQRRLRVEPAVDFENLRELLILTGLYRNEALSLRTGVGEDPPLLLPEEES